MLAPTSLCLTRVAVVLVGLALVGCGKYDHLAPLTGKVLYNGRPLEFGTVNLRPVDGGEFTRGIIQSDGSFAMKTNDGTEGAAIGVNSVRVTCFTGQRPGAAAQRGDEEASLGRSLIPHHYNQFSSSGLSVEVKPESNEPFVINIEGG